MRKREVIIIGGGLAGLTAAIHLSKNQIPVLLFEKEEFPRHKVCGEYLSNEILPYLDSLQIPLPELLPQPITRLLFSTTSGDSIEADLPLGGMGVSRYALDELFYRQALNNGVELIHKKVDYIEFRDDHFEVAAGEEKFKAAYVLGAFGKRSGLDKTLGRSFFGNKAPWLAIKGHFAHPSFPENLVALHNFRGGYCGLSRTETGAVNLCYLSSYKSFKPYKDPEEFQLRVLCENPFLKEFLSSSSPIFEQPLSIAQISFEKKTRVEQHMLLLGDAAGLLHPLCGNGMAMAIQSARIASELLIKALRDRSISRNQLEESYLREWDLNFRRRIRTGRVLQKVLLNRRLTAVSQQLLTNFPSLLPQIIKQTHGQPNI